MDAVQFRSSASRPRSAGPVSAATAGNLMNLARLLGSRNGRVLASCTLGLASVLAATTAAAQDRGFSLNRFDRSEAGSDWFAGESLDLRGHARPALGLTLDWAHKPLVLYDAKGNEVAALLQNQLYAHLGGALVLWDRVRFGAELPIALWQSGQAAILGTTTLSPSTSTTVGDLRVGGDVRLLGQYGDALTLAAGLQLHLPTGSRSAYTGDGKLRVTPRLMVAGDIAAFAYSARLGFNYRAQGERLANVATGSELQFVATAGVRVLDKKLLLGPELWGSTVVSKGAAFGKETTPFELVLGGHYRIPNFIFGLGVGPGLTRGLGAPAARLLASVDFIPDVPKPLPPAVAPEPLPEDRDRDGILDRDDACPDTHGVKSDDPKKNGCPPDRDGDGITDDVDACPDLPGVASDDPRKNGCPGDRDRDGIADAQDACPDVPGIKSEDPNKNGCPGDRDRDGFTDDVDACPDAPGEASSDPKKNGCPAARVEQGQIKIIERIEFKTDSAQLLPSSEPILDAVQKIMAQHPEITRLSVEGHTDNVGSEPYNEGLSQRRAETVVGWLVKHGIARARLEGHGFGLTRPIDSNFTSAGRERNRRVEFHINEIEGKAVPRQAADAPIEEN
jgi:OOP family OmpA-OmpF porin